MGDVHALHRECTRLVHSRRARRTTEEVRTRLFSPPPKQSGRFVAALRKALCGCFG